MKFSVVLAIFFTATAAHAQSVTNRVTSTVGGVSSTAGAAVGAVTGPPDFSALNSTPGAGPGGDWNGGTRTRIGGKDVTIRGAVASEGGSSAFKAGAGIGF
jgi:hypothetical protein